MGKGREDWQISFGPFNKLEGRLQWGRQKKVEKEKVNG